MVKLKAYTIIESMISLAIVTGIVLMMSLIFTNILSSDKNIHKIKAQELIDEYTNEGILKGYELYELKVDSEQSKNWGGLYVLTYKVFYRDRLVLKQKKISQE